VTPRAGLFADQPVNDRILPGYKPDPLESLGLLVSQSDMDGPDAFVAAACTNSSSLSTVDTHLDQELHTRSEIWAISLASGSNSSTSQPANPQENSAANQTPSGSQGNPNNATPSASPTQTGNTAPTTGSAPAGGTGSNPVANVVGGAVNLASAAVNTVLGGGSPTGSSNPSALSGGFGFSPSLVLASGTKSTNGTVTEGPAIPPSASGAQPKAVYQQVTDTNGVAPGSKAYIPTYGSATASGQTALYQQVPDKHGNQPGTANYSETYAPATIVENKTTTTSLPGNLLGITQCSLKVIRAAVNICIYRGASRSTANEVLNNVLGSGLAVGGAAAGIAALARASGKATAVIGGAGVLGSALFGTFQKDVPPGPGQSQASAVLSSGLQYLVLDETLTQPYDNANFDQISPLRSDTGATADQVIGSYRNSYAHLFDAAMQGCTIADQ
jgi:hypothetical protein